MPTIEDELAALGVAPARVVVVPNGVALPPPVALDAAAAAARPLTVLFGGRLDAQKDLPTLLEAWREVATAFPDARLVLAGEGPERAGLLARRDALGLATSVELPGFVADYAERLAGCAVFVLPSRFEGMSNALLEAMAAARACLTSDLAENRHTLGDAGRCFAVGDARALASVLVELLGSAAERARLGVLGRRRAEERFALGAVADRYLGLYRELLAR
ncbi:MAG: glycosyltransferase [Deltaproteobacteria bacterium]|nr:glycosyltransferase [Deltaproteobacteria bacterium]